MGLVHRARADVLRLQTPRGSELMFYPQAPLHEVRCVESAIWDRCDRNRRKTTCGICLWTRELALGKSRSKSLIRGNGCVYGAVRRSGRDCGAAHAAKHSSLKRLIVGRIRANQVGNSARQDVAENPEASSKNRLRLKLPRNRGSRLQDGQRGRREQIAEMSLDGSIQRLSDIMGDGTERAAKTSDLLMPIQRIGVEGVAQAERPGQRASHFPGVLRVEIEI